MLKNYKKFIYLPIFFAIVFVAGMLLGVKLIRYTSEISYPFKEFFSFNLNNYDKLNDVINYIESSYVDSVSKKKLTEDAINGLLQSLDPHSYSISADEFNDVNDPLMGNFEGIGVEFRIIRDTIVVINTVAGGPSEKCGVKAGDKIVKINGQSVAGIKISNEQVIKKLKGKKKTEVKISVCRLDVPKRIDFIIIRDVIPTFSIDVAYMVTRNIGYIKLNKFSRTTSDEFFNALSLLKRKGMTKLILDLRGNGGGFMDAAIQLSDEFLSKGKLIVYAEGKHCQKKSSYSTEYGTFENGELVVLIDEFSASASEILAGAVQDNDRGLVIGRRSFGKGLIQEQIELLDGSAIRITVARYHTPTGRCIQKSYKNGINEYNNEFYNRFIDGEMLNPDSILLIDSLKYRTPKGKIVYGGGGIMPDIFVPIDTAKHTQLFIQLYNNGTIYQFALDYTSKHRKQLKFMYPSKDSYINTFVVSDTIIENLFAQVFKNDIKQYRAKIITSASIIKQELKAFIGKNLYGNGAFYPILNSTDKTFLKAVNVMKR